MWKPGEILAAVNEVNYNHPNDESDSNNCAVHQSTQYNTDSGKLVRKEAGSELSEESSVILRYQSKYTHSVNTYTTVFRYTCCVDVYHAVLDCTTRLYYSACILIL